ncbi:P-loop containing nucleoside triphosphate hydrolase protein, partial [Desarmillaria tabescens]
VDIESIVDQFNLNTEQARAFRLVASHSLASKPDPLRMFLSGAGGTGKSTVINAIWTYFNQRGQDRRFRLTSYTRIAARNISGMTIHSALMLNQRNKRGASTKTNCDLIAMWQGVDYLFIDEISMVGCKTLMEISNALC